MMNDQQKLNSILRLRLFRSTEKELSSLIGYKLKTNHFNHLGEFQQEAFLCWFSKQCRELTQQRIDLNTLLEQYEATSRFYQKHVARQKHGKNKRLPIELLCHLLGRPSGENSKMQKLSAAYDEWNGKGGLNIGILLLMTAGLLPVFNNRKDQDIKDIIEDFQTAYDILQEIADSRKGEATTLCREMICLREMRQLIEEERAGDKYLNRLLLIFITNDVLNRIFALENPDLLQSLMNEIVPMRLDLPRFWHKEGEPSNVVWEIEETNINTYYFHRKEIDYQNKQIRVSTGHVRFQYMGHEDFCYSVIMRPAFMYHNILKRELPEDAIAYDYTDIEYDEEGSKIKSLTFSQSSPLENKPSILTPIEGDDILRYYENYIDRLVEAERYAEIDCDEEFAVYMDNMEVAVNSDALFFKFDNGVFRLDKFDEDGNETIAGIAGLKHDDNFIYAELYDDGKLRRFLCLDSINRNLDLDDLERQCYFQKIAQAKEVFQ